jgi:DNA-binding HxlR family transcriptional regulator
MRTVTNPALDRALARVGDRWSLLVVEALAAGPSRFADLEAVIPAIAPNVLSARLRRLAADGIVEAATYSTRPVRLRYSLTEVGRDLLDAARLLAGWGATLPGTPLTDAARHGACGTPLEARLWCPTCATVVDGDDGVHHV